MLAFFLSGLVIGINDSSVLPQAAKDGLTELVTQSTGRMDRAELEAELEKILGPPPNEYYEDLSAITGDSIRHSMRAAYYTLGGIMAAGLAASLLLSKRKLAAAPGDASGSI